MPDNENINTNATDAIKTIDNIAREPGVKVVVETDNATMNRNIKIVYPAGTDRGTIDSAMGKSYLLKDTDGNFIPNKSFILEQFDEADHSIDLKQFVDMRTVVRNGKAEWDTDSIKNSKNSETNSISDTTGGTSNANTQVLRKVVLVNTIEKGTRTSVINLRDNDNITALNLSSSDLAQHGRANRLIDNRFILAKMIQGSKLIDSGFEYDTTLTGEAKDAALIALGKVLYPYVRDEIIAAEETMTIQRPGGFEGAQDLFALMSPLAQRAITSYQSSLPSSDKAFQVAVEGKPYMFSIEGVKIYKTNLLVGGQKLVVNGITEFENDDNVEVLIGYKGYLKYVEAEPFIQSTAPVVDNMIVPHLLAQRTEGMHNAVMIVADLFKAIKFTRKLAVVVPTQDVKEEINN